MGQDYANFDAVRRCGCELHQYVRLQACRLRSRSFFRLSMTGAVTSAATIFRPSTGWRELIEEWLSPTARAHFLASAEGQIRGDPESRGLFQDGDFGLQRGLVLSTGRAASIASARVATAAADDFGPEGPVGDSAGLSLSFTSTRAAWLSFEYVFATQELPTFDGMPVTDG